MIAGPAAAAGVFYTHLEASHQQRPGSPTYDEDVALLLRTSGTTARAKIVPHTVPRLMHICTSIVDALNMQPADRCLVATPLHHVHAITHVIGATLVAGASVVCPPEIGAAALVDALRRHRPTWYTASPTSHRDVLAYVQRESVPFEHGLRFIRSTSAPLDRQVAVDLEATFGVPVLESYGTSEAPTTTMNLPAPNARKLGSVGRAVGCEVAILDGEVAIRGANVAPSYAGGDRWPIIDPFTGWYRTGDAGRIDADGFLSITGRLNDLINVGGEKVAPGHVEEALRAHPAIADAVAFPLPHPTLGQHVAAAVVPRTGATLTERHVIEHAALLLARAAVPNVVHFIAAIPRDGSGKVQRRDLTATFARDSRIALPEASSPEDDSILRGLARIWEDVLEYAPVARDENFFAAGGDSLRAIRVMTRIEADLGVTMSADMLLFAPTIRELARAVRTQTNGVQRDRIVALRTAGSRPPLFFYDSDTDGGGLYARFLTAALDSEQPVYLVRPHGALGDAIPESIEAMAAADAAIIATTVPARAYRLAGFCAGGVVAFEVARRLERAGSTVDVLALVASSAPNASLERLATVTWRISRFVSQRNAVRAWRIVRSIANAMRTRSYPAEIVNAISELWQPVAAQTPSGQIYTDRLLRYFPNPTARSIDLIWPNDDKPIIAGDPSMGWSRVARVRHHAVGGDHATVLTDHVAELGAVLRRIVDAADRAQPDNEPPRSHLVMERE
jgi:thioesterase domain-containing protein/acyl carrier protein